MERRTEHSAIEGTADAAGKPLSAQKCTCSNHCMVTGMSYPRRPHPYYAMKGARGPGDEQLLIMSREGCSHRKMFRDGARTPSCVMKGTRDE